VAVACNDAVLHAPDGAHPEWTITGDPTEGALLAFAGKVDVEHDDVRRQWPRTAEIGFDAGRRRMTTVHRDGDATWWVAVKGALGSLVPLLDQADAALALEAERAADALAEQGYRVLALPSTAPSSCASPSTRWSTTSACSGWSPSPTRRAPRSPTPSRRAALPASRPVMVTGDHVGTGRAIAQRLGMVDGNADSAVLTGTELDELDDAALAGAHRRHPRVRPHQSRAESSASSTPGRRVARSSR